MRPFLLGWRVPQEAPLARTVLIVDDDAALGRLYAESLAPEGWRVLVERDVAGAAEAFRAREVDLVVLDAHLAAGTGFELAEQIRRDPRGAEVPLLFISGVYKAARHRAAVIDQFGAVDFLEKPVAPGELAARIRIALGPEAPGTPVRPYVEAPLVPTPALTSLPPLSFTMSGPLAAGAQRGDLSQRPFHEVFADLARSRATGLLAVRREKVKKIVSLRDGRPVGVKSNLLSDCLGRVMVRAGLLTEAQCGESLELLRASGRPQGQVLLELGYIDERTLDEALEQQLEQKLFDVFAWEAGEFQFLPKVADDASQTLVEMSAARALHEGLVRTSDEARLRRLLGAVDHQAVRVQLLAAEAIASLANADEMRPFAASMDGTRPLSQLLEVKMVPLVQALALVVTLRALGLAELAAPRPVKQPQRVTRPPRRAFGPVDLNDPDGLGRLEERLDELSRATHYQVLGVVRSATAGEIRKAYVAAAREFHPDKHYAGAPSDIRQLAEKIFDRYTNAQAVLGDLAERARYDGEFPETPYDRGERILRSDEAFRAARLLFEKGLYLEASARFKDAVDGYPEEAAFHAWLGLALWQTTPDASAAPKALALLDRASQLHPRLSEAPLFASHIWRAMGDEARASEEYSRAEALAQPVPR